jgi:hypothetical protein
LINRLLPPLCLLLALAMLIAGFTLLALESPEASVALHRARVTGDEAYQEVLEASLERRQLGRKLLLGSLFAGAGLMTVLAFLVMAPSKNPS